MYPWEFMMKVGPYIDSFPKKNANQPCQNPQPKCQSCLNGLEVLQVRAAHVQGLGSTNCLGQHLELGNRTELEKCCEIRKVAE